MKYKEWTWNSDLITNQENVDYQHQSLFRVINDLIRACNLSEKTDALLVEVALDELLKYTDFHFRDEEALMEKFHYADLKSHHEQHAKFIQVMKDFQARFHKNEDIADDLIKFMQKWLVDHILTRDKEAMKVCC